MQIDLSKKIGVMRSGQLLRRQIVNKSKHYEKVKAKSKSLKTRESFYQIKHTQYN